MCYSRESHFVDFYIFLEVAKAYQLTVTRKRFIYFTILDNSNSWMVTCRFLF